MSVHADAEDEETEKTCVAVGSQAGCCAGGQKDGLFAEIKSAAALRIQSILQAHGLFCPRSPSALMRNLEKWGSPPRACARHRARSRAGPASTSTLISSASVSCPGQNEAGTRIGWYHSALHGSK